jgi:hypothetical protein
MTLLIVDALGFALGSLRAVPTHYHILASIFADLQHYKRV